MESKLQILNSDDSEAKLEVLKDFIQEFSDQFNFPTLDEDSVRSTLWKAIYGVLKDDKQENLHELCLKLVRLLSREKKSLNELLPKDFITLILTIAGLGCTNNNPIYNDKLIEALKACCNILFNANIVREVCLNNGILEGIFNRIQHYKDQDIPIDVKILDVKILFILTALQSESRVKANETLNGISSLIEVLQHTFEMYKNEDNEELKQKQSALIGEILKTLFNLTVHTDVDIDVGKDLVVSLREYLLWEYKNKEITNELNSHVINLLINVPECALEELAFECKEISTSTNPYLYRDYDMTAIHVILECFNNHFTNQLTISKHMELLSPVITVLRNCARSSCLMRGFLRSVVLPPLKDARSRPEEEDSYRGHFCKLLTSPITEVRDLAADFLFILCKENVNRMIKYTGYGNAAGMFATRGLMLGGKSGNAKNYSSDSENSDTEEYNELKSHINPVMGCYQADRPKATDNMTEEQKEYEAMKLVNLMDNLTRTGIVKPCTVGSDGKPKPIEHVLQLQEGLKAQQIRNNDDEDDD